jgi:DNA-binding NarL/FixJ family response regulator
MKILLVDDEQPILDWLRLTITSLSTDYEIIGTATNGNDALALYRRMAPDIVFTDIKMPTMDGLAFLRELTNQQHYSYIVVLSNHDDFSYARESFMCNAEKYILKTEIDKESLEILLREAEEKVRSHATAGPSHSILNVELLIRRMAALTPVTEEQIEKAFSSGYNNLSPNGIFAVAVRLSAPLSIEQSANLPEQDHIKNVSLFYIDDLTILFLANIAHVHSALMRTSTIFAFASKIRTQFHCSIGISETYNGFAMLPQAIRQCMNALDMNFPHNVNANTMQIYSDTALQAMDYPFDTLMRGIEEQDLSTVCTEMNNLFSSIRSRTIVSRKTTDPSV